VSSGHTKINSKELLKTPHEDFHQVGATVIQNNKPFILRSKILIITATSEYKLNEWRLPDAEDCRMLNAQSKILGTSLSISGC
jgi:hypothetical protein